MDGTEATLEGRRTSAPSSSSSSQDALHLQSPLSKQRLVLEPGRAEREYWRDVWRYRELFLVLAWRDVAVRYKQTVLGIAWAAVRPLLTMLILAFVFGRVARLPSPAGVPYPMFVLAGLLPWYLFSSILGDAAASILANSNLVTKVYFPRMVVPLATGLVALLDFGFSLAIFLGLMVWYGVWPTWRMLALPPLVVLTVIASVGPALWVAQLNVKYRDFRYIIPFVLQIGLYVSPVAFSPSLVPESLRFTFGLNPLVGIISAFRWSLLGDVTPVDAHDILSSAIMSALLLWWGVSRFRRSERAFADQI